MDLKAVQAAFVSRQACIHSRSAAGLRKSPTFSSGGRHNDAAHQLLNYNNSFPKPYQAYNLQHFTKHTPSSNYLLHTRDESRNHKFSAKATASGEPPESSSYINIWESAKNGISIFYKFSRPYAQVGTNFGIVSMSLLAIENLSDFSPLFFAGLLKAMAVAFCINIYIAGLNQLTDIEIDKVNKPYLPLASGEMSYSTAVLIVASAALMSFWGAFSIGSRPLIAGIIISFLLGNAYSVNLPLLRWKNSRFLSLMFVLSYRAVLTQVVYYMHMRTHVFRRPAIFPRTLIFAIAFVSFFAVVIALVKDIPDMEGDKKFGIQSFSSRLGVERVFWTCVSILEMAYAVGICVSSLSPNSWSKVVTVLGHTLLALLLWKRAKSINLKDKDATQGFYMFVWKLLCAEYLLFPLMR